VIGPNGAGKSSLLRAIIGEIPSTGKITYTVKGRPGEKPRIGYVPQKINFASDSPVSVLDLLAAALACGPVCMGVGKHTRETAMEALAKVDSQKLIDKRIGELSGGELQRVMLALAMTPVPDLLLLDEPLSAADINATTNFYEIVNNLKKQYDISIIIVTHNLQGILPYADRMILLNRAIIAEGSPQEVLADKKMLEVFQISL